MSKIRVFNRRLPQTLLVANLLLYIEVVFAILRGDVRTPVYLLFTLAFVVGGLGIANERRFAYFTAIAGSGFFAFYTLILLVTGSYGLVLRLMIAVALTALLLHPMSREYQRIWFK